MTLVERTPEDHGPPMAPRQRGGSEAAVDYVRWQRLRSLMAPDRTGLIGYDDLVRRPSWMERARCRGQGTEAFFRPFGAEGSAAKAICATCDVRAECLDHALQDPELRASGEGPPSASASGCGGPGPGSVDTATSRRRPNNSRRRRSTRTSNRYGVGTRPFYLSEVVLYADDFATAPGCCWRTVLSSKPRKAGQPLHCPEPAAVRGIFRSPTGEGFWVESCMDHAVDLERVGPLTQSSASDGKADHPA